MIRHKVVAVKPFIIRNLAMAAQSIQKPRFVRRTRLGPGEYRKHFHQIDEEIVAAVTSEEADRVTPLMSKIYLRLVNAPAQHWEREGVLRFEAETGQGRLVKAWDALCETVGVASATASKALRWMHEQGIIGYFSGKNGVGIRIFLNRAASSIGVRTAPGGKKILEFSRTSSGESRASTDEAAFIDSYAVSESSDTELNPRPPVGGADKPEVDEKSPDLPVTRSSPQRYEDRAAVKIPPNTIPVHEIVRQLKRELEPSLQAATRTAAAEEHERTRGWLENRGLPKAARVAQREAYNVLRQHGLVGAAAGKAGAGLNVGRGECVSAEPRPLTSEEIRELAETCVAMLEVHGQAIDTTLAGLSAEAGGVLLARDAPGVRELAEAMAYGGGKG
jgi:hypothetical protein